MIPLKPKGANPTEVQFLVSAKTKHTTENQLPYLVTRTFFEQYQSEEDLLYLLMQNIMKTTLMNDRIVPTNTRIEVFYSYVLNRLHGQKDNPLNLSEPRSISPVIRSPAARAIKSGVAAR